MRDAFLYALAALGAVSLGRWLFGVIALAVMKRTGLLRRFRRASLRHTLETITSEEWQEGLQRDVGELVVDVSDAVDRVIPSAASQSTRRAAGGDAE
jgi:hypothetical protein